MSKLLIRGGRVVDPASGLDAVRDVLIEGDRIAAIGESLAAEGAEVYDAAGKIVAPGFIDLRARLREPGLEHAETIETGSRAAAAGGFTAVCAMPDTTPCNDSATVTSFILSRAEHSAVVDILPIGALTQGCEGEQLAEIGSLRRAGAAAVGDGDRSVLNAGVMRRAMRYAASFGLTVIAHCEDRNLSGDGELHEGPKSVRLGLKGVPPSAETAMIARDIILSGETGARLHVAHLSTAAGVELIRRARAEGLPVTAEVSAHHIALTVDDVPDYDSNYKVLPPLRAPEDRDALIEGLADGTISAIVSDHAPHTGNVKMQEFEHCPFGISALETAVAIAIECLLATEKISLERLVELFTAGPAAVLGLDRGRLAVGAAAAVTILELDREWTFGPDSTLSKSKSSPFMGRTFRGGSAATIVGGRIVWDRDNGLADL